MLVLTEAGQAKLARYLAPRAAEEVAPETPTGPERVKVGRWTFEVVRWTPEGAVVYRNREGAEVVTDHSPGRLTSSALARSSPTCDGPCRGRA